MTSLAADSHLGTYRLISKLGAGGMGEVWKAEDTRLGRTVAIKILPPEIANNSEARARLSREARTAAQLYHGNIAMIHSMEQEADRAFIVMEYVDGESLSSRIARGNFSEAEIAQIGKGVADALAEAHARGVVHRDIKPDNVMLIGTRVKVLDFGIAKQVASDSLMRETDPTQFVTEAGMIVGTVHYMSPEQALGRPLDARSDIFSLGVVLYQAATGKLPFGGASVTETLTQIIRDEPADPQSVNRQMSPELAGIIRKCMRKERDERFASAAELSAAFEHLLLRANTAPARAAAPVGVIAPTVKTGAAAVARRPAALLPIAAIAAAFAAVGLVGWLLFGGASRGSAFSVRKEPVPGPVPAAAASESLEVSAQPPIPEHLTGAQEMPVIVEEEPLPAVVPLDASTAAATETVAEAAPVTVPAAEPGAPPVLSSEERAARAYAEGTSFMRLGQMQKAAAAFQQAIQADRDHAPANLALAQILLIAGNRAGAAGHLRRAIGRRDDLDERQQRLAQICLALVAGGAIKARTLAAEFDRDYPADPDLERLRRFLAPAGPDERRQRRRRGAVQRP